VSFIPKRGGSSGSAGVPTDDRGAYTVTGLGDGEYIVNVMDMQRLNPYTTSYEVHGSGNFDIDIRTAVIHGRVVDSATGEGINDVRVQLRGASQDTPMMMFPQRGAITDANGNFTLDSVSAGRYVASADKDTYGNQQLDLNVTESGASELEFKLSRNDGITLQVVDARDGRAIRGNAYVTDMQGRVVQDESGFSFGGGVSVADLRLPLGPGSYRATLSAYGYASQTITVTSPGKQKIGLTPGGTLVIRSKESTPRRARLLDASGAVYIRSRMKEFTIDVGTNTLQYIAPGSYTLQFLDNTDHPTGASTQVNVVEGQTTNFDA